MHADRGQQGKPRQANDRNKGEMKRTLKMSIFEEIACVDSRGVATPLLPFERACGGWPEGGYPRHQRAPHAPLQHRKHTTAFYHVAFTWLGVQWGACVPPENTFHLKHRGAPTHDNGHIGIEPTLFVAPLFLLILIQHGVLDAAARALRDVQVTGRRVACGARKDILAVA
jgi:hypothetical protein